MRINPDYLITCLILLVLLALNARATWAVLQDHLCEARQRLAQLAIVWLLPMAGALLVLAVHRKPQKPSGRYRDRDHDHDEPAVPSHPAKSVLDALDD